MFVVDTGSLGDTFDTLDKDDESLSPVIDIIDTLNSAYEIAEYSYYPVIAKFYKDINGVCKFCGSVTFKKPFWIYLRQDRLNIDEQKSFIDFIRLNLTDSRLGYPFHLQWCELPDLF